jgi:hypothetical protein
LARTLTFSIGDNEYNVSPSKIDREKLYGWSEVIALDDDGKKCNFVSMDETGTIIIPKGNLGLGILSSDGKWLERNSLKTVYMDGKDVKIIPSSYDETIHLKKIATPEELLDHIIIAFYELIGTDPSLIEKVKSNIYTFTYSYSKGYEGNQAFLIENENSLFLLVGHKIEFKMVSLNELSEIKDKISRNEKDLEDSIDFTMF